MSDITKGRILHVIRSGKSFFTEIEEETGASSATLGRYLSEMEKEGLIIVELDRSTGRKRPCYKLNKDRMDEIQKLIDAYIKSEGKESVEKLNVVMHYIDFTEEEKKEIAELVEKIKKKLNI